MHRNNGRSTYARQHYWSDVWRGSTEAERTTFTREVNARLAGGIDADLPALIYAGFPVTMSVPLGHALRRLARPSRVPPRQRVANATLRVRRRARRR
jgi:hypothetical protein